jgi:hypothetical protein
VVTSDGVMRRPLGIIVCPLSGSCQDTVFDENKCHFKREMHLKRAIYLLTIRLNFTKGGK